MSRAKNYLDTHKIVESKEPELEPDIVESLDEGIEPINFKSSKEIAKKLPKAMEGFSKGWDKMWKDTRDCQQKWSDSHWTMSYTLKNLRNTLEANEVEISDELNRDIRHLEEALDSMAKVHQWGGVAPMGSAKRQMKNIQPVMDRVVAAVKNIQ